MDTRSILRHDKCMSKGSILVIEDEEHIREVLTMILEMEGYRVRAAQNGRAAVDSLQEKGDVDVIVLDLMMPVMNGWEFLQEMRKSHAQHRIPVIILSAFTGKVQPEGWVEEVLEKPVDVDSLLSAVDRVRHRPRQAAH